MAYLEDPHVMEQFTVISHKAVVSSGTHGFYVIVFLLPPHLPSSFIPAALLLYHSIKPQDVSVISGSIFKETWTLKK